MPDDEKFGLMSQMRRASISIESNLAEGCGRDNDKEFARFIDISMGSSFELRCQLLIARDLNYIDPEQCQLYESKIIEVNKMLGSLLKRLRATPLRGRQEASLLSQTIAHSRCHSRLLSFAQRA